MKVFETPSQPDPTAGGNVNYVALRDACGRQRAGATVWRATKGGRTIAATKGSRSRQTASRLFAVLQDPLINEPGPNNGRTGRNVRIVVFDNDRHSPTLRSRASHSTSTSWNRRPTSRRGSTRSSRATRRRPIRGRAATSACRRSTPSTTRSSWSWNATIVASASTTLRRARRRQQTRLQDRHQRCERRDDDSARCRRPAGRRHAGHEERECSSTSPPTHCCPAASRRRSGKGWRSDRSSWGGRRLILIGNDNDYSVTQTGAASSSMSTSTLPAISPDAFSTTRRSARSTRRRPTSSSTTR